MTSIAGHFATVSALLRRLLFPVEPPASRAWATTIDDPFAGRIALSGRSSRPAGARDLVLLVHGLGGSSDSGYMVGAARAADALGLASLRLSLRGADGRGGDFYHAGLTDDLHAAVRGLPAGDFDRVFVLGFSLGGHVTLRFATEVEDPRVAAVAAVCSPLVLAAGADAMDQPHMALYRGYILRTLKANYEKTARSGRVPTPPERVREVKTFREWDALTVAPRFGFDGAEDYYTKASVAPVIDRLRRPALLVGVENDPMIPPRAIRPALSAAGDGRLEVRWLERGGHLGFPARLDLGLPGAPGLASQVLLWLLRAGAEERPPQAPPRE